MIKTRVRQVYKPDNKTSNIPGTKNRAGVYMIYISGKLRYIGYSGSNLQKTIMRHFQSWDDKTQVRTTYGMHDRKNATVRVTICNTPEQAKRLEAGLIIKHRPPDNPDKIKRLITKEEEQEVVNWFNTEVSNNKEWEEAPF